MNDLSNPEASGLIFAIKKKNNFKILFILTFSLFTLAFRFMNQ